MQPIEQHRAWILRRTRALPKVWPVVFSTLVVATTPGRRARADMPPRPAVTGGHVIADAVVRPVDGQKPFEPTPWSALSRTRRAPGTYEVRLQTHVGAGEDALELPHCAGRSQVRVDGATLSSSSGPLVTPLSPGAHEVVVRIRVSAYEHRIACGEPPKVGRTAPSGEGLQTLSFESPYGARGGGHAIVYVPPGHDRARPGPVLVGLHPWNGDAWTYTAYEELLREAAARDVVLLFPSGLGNSLYTANAEDEALRALSALARELAVDPKRVSLWGASMGGAGATTVGFHHPDRFAAVTSFFGDSKYDRTTYVRALLPTEADAHAVNALDVVENARALPVWLIHGEADHTSPIVQSEMLDRAMRERGFQVRFDRAPGMGHEGALVVRYIAEVVDRAAVARVPDVTRVTYRSVRPSDTGAYGVRIVRASSQGDAFVDVERGADGKVRVRRTTAVRGIRLAPGALGVPSDERPPVIFDDPSVAVDVTWGTP